MVNTGTQDKAGAKRVNFKEFLVYIILGRKGGRGFMMILIGGVNVMFHVFQVDLLRGQKSDKVDVTLLPEELDAMENVLPAKYKFYFFIDILLPVSDV